MKPDSLLRINQAERNVPSGKSEVDLVMLAIAAINDVSGAISPKKPRSLRAAAYRLAAIAVTLAEGTPDTPTPTDATPAPSAE